MTTVGDLVTRIDNRLRRRRREVLLFGSGTQTTAATTLEVTERPAGVQGGMIVESEFEQQYVKSATGTTLTVLRGYGGTTAVQHADATTVVVEPRWPKQEILDQMKSEILSWPKSLFQVSSVDLAFGASDTESDLTGVTTNVIRILAAQEEPPTTNDRWKWVPVRFTRDHDTGDFASGMAIHLQRPAFGVATTVRVTYGHAFDVSTFTSSTDLTSVCGIPESMYDIIEFGTAYRILAMGEADRTDTSAQGSPRLAEEVAGGLSAQVATFMLQQRNLRIAEEEAKLYARYPDRFS